ncbi:MAG: transcriptional repressor LexA [Leptospiraceae bacterium]|nr:transcriptional repressor LexA [Leptospiraceae bacterium]MDW7976775.1 transcriptional repressor LexA [Leptospiraceae bacterium]
MKDLTQKQKQILEFITRYTKEKNYPPSIREIAEHFKITPKGAYDHLKAIEKKGFIKTEKNRSRAIEIVKSQEQQEFIKIPLLGRIAAGAPILAEENIEDYLTFPRAILPANSEKEIFALRVTGDSMIDAKIHDGDIAIIRKTSIAENGDIVVALIGDEATLKYFYKEKDHVRLEPANPKYKPIITKEVIILGKMIGLYKRFE